MIDDYSKLIDLIDWTIDWTIFDPAFSTGSREHFSNAYNF